MADVAVPCVATIQSACNDDGFMSMRDWLGYRIDSVRTSTQ